MQANSHRDPAMYHQGSVLFATYTRNLRRLYWAEFIETQVRAARTEQFRASIVQPSIPETDNLAVAYDYHRQRPLID